VPFFLGLVALAAGRFSLVATAVVVARRVVVLPFLTVVAFLAERAVEARRVPLVALAFAPLEAAFVVLSAAFFFPVDSPC
jgi:hydrogenase-4 membrane subunit HyfE